MFIIKKNWIVVLLISLVLMIVSCKPKDKPDDINAKPEIIVETISVPLISEKVCGVLYDNTLKVSTGSTLVLNLRFKGSNNLSQYKIEAHENFDCHVHGRPAKKPWSLNRVMDITGKDFFVEEELIIPGDADAGNYHLEIKLLDELGNEAESKEFNLILINSTDTEKPEIFLEKPDTTFLTLSKGDTLFLRGIVSDNYSLKNGNLDIYFRDVTGTRYTAKKIYFPTDEAIKVFSFDTFYIIPNHPQNGKARFFLNARDEVNNTNEVMIEVMIQ